MIVLVTRNDDLAHRAMQLARERGCALQRVNADRLPDSLSWTWPELVLVDMATTHADGVLAAVEDAETIAPQRGPIAMAVGDGYGGTLRELLDWFRYRS